MFPGLKFWYVAVICLSLVGVALFIKSRQPAPTFLSPLGEFSNFYRPKFKAEPAMETIGFLPYWNLDKTQVGPANVGQLIYFGLIAEKNGQIKRIDGWEMEPGWANFNTPKWQEYFVQAKSKKKKVLLTVLNFDDEEMNKLLASDEDKTNLIREIIEVIGENNLDGVNIDFEYFSAENREFGANFNDFLEKLKAELTGTGKQMILSVDIYPKAVIQDKPYRLKELAGIADQVILMAYDFTQSNTERTGPVAPLRPSDEGKYSINQALQASFGKIDRQKLILGIPLYGYEWPTVNAQPRSFVQWGISGVTASYERVKKLIEEHKLPVNWDDLAYSPWLNYNDEGVNKQIYFENIKSITAKVDLARQLDLGGVAFWALGYEGNDPELWAEIRKKL